MSGEEKQIYTENGSGRVSWRNVTGNHDHVNEQDLLWFQGRFDIPHLNQTDRETTAFALDLSSMYKGHAFVNGFDIGRYWMINGACSGTCAIGHNQRRSDVDKIP